MANIKINKCHIYTFALALTVFEILTFEIFDVEKLGHGQRVQHSQ